MLKDIASKLCCVSIVGGEGRRLRPFTSERPKALLPVGIEKKPMLEFVMMPWIKVGIKKYLFCTGYRGEMIEKHFRDGNRLGVHIDYSTEKISLETGGAIKNAIDNKILSKNQPIIIFYCDDFVKLNTQDFLKSHLHGVNHGFKATLVATSKFKPHYGILETENISEGIKKVVDFKEKPLIDKNANVGIYCLEPEVLELIDKFEPPFKFEKVILPELVKRGWLMVYEIPWDYWLPVNTDKEYDEVLKMNLTNFYQEF
jgi:mannose-1-phosphate guanylyltransferase